MRQKVPQDKDGPRIRMDLRKIFVTLCSKKGRPRPSFFAIDRCQTGSRHYRE